MGFLMDSEGGVIRYEFRALRDVLMPGRPRETVVQVLAGCELVDHTTAPGRAQRGIRCGTCGVTSFHPKDVEERFCARCHKFHARPEHGLPEIPMRWGVSPPFRGPAPL